MTIHEHPQEHRSRGMARPLAALTAATLLFGACSADQNDESTADAAPATEFQGGEDSGSASSESGQIDASGDEAAAEDGDAATSTTGSATNAEPTSVAPIDAGRSIIFTGAIQVEVDDVATAGVDAVEAIEGIGGFVFGQDTVGGVEPTSTYTFKVRPDQFDEALDLLAGVGELQNQTISADDVTERVVDLDSRIEVAELGVARLRTALEESTTFEDYAAVEELLLSRESELEVMRGQRRTLADQISLATITLTLTQDRTDNTITINVDSYEGHDGGRSCPGDDRTRPEAGTDLTVCFELINTGDQDLTDLTLVDSGLDIEDIDELTIVFGQLDEPLQPGQSVILAHESTPERSLRLRTRVSAQPLVTDQLGAEPAGPSVSSVIDQNIDVTPNTDDPGFSDGFDAGTGLIAGLWSGAKVIAGFIVPLLVLAPLFVGLIWLWRRRPKRAKRQQPPTQGFGGPPPPAPMPAVPTPPAAPTATTPPNQPAPSEPSGV